MTVQTIQPLSPDLVLPWTPSKRQEEQFNNWVKKVLIVLLLLFIVFPFLPVFESDYVPPEKTVVKTKVMLEADKIIPPKKKVRPKVQKKIAIKPEKTKKNKSKTSSEKKKKTASKAKKPSSTKSRSAGLASFSSQLTALRGNLNVAGMKQKKSVRQGKGTVATVDRNILGENRATRETMGIDVDENIMKTSSVQLSAHQTSNVEGIVSVGGSSAGDDSVGAYVSGQRDKESVKRVMDQKKGLIYALYYNALNEYPQIHGKFIFKFDILPDGKIINLVLVSSELGVTKLERKMLSRIATFDFGRKDVSSTHIQFRFNFIPS